MGDVGAAFKQANRRQVAAVRNPGDNLLEIGLGVSAGVESEQEKEEKAAALEAARITGGLEESVEAEKRKTAALAEQKRKKTLGRRSTILTGGRGVTSEAATGRKKTLGA